MSRSKRNWDYLVDEFGNYDGKGGGGGGGGQKGEPGDKGDPGGQKGEPGDKGDTGATGAAGTNGTNGAPGATGQKGAPGDKGDDGDKGDTGDKGAPGAVSAKGDVGPKGDDGDKGDKGLPGNLAAKGDTGDKGDKGDFTKGDKGDFLKGDKGTPGDKGATGDKGAPGDKGDEGQKGQKGQKGEIGDKGNKGTAAPLLSYQGFVVDATALPAQPQPAGDTYYVLSTGRYVTSDGTSYGDAGQMIKGDKGTKGDVGVKGQKGAKGTDGLDGAKGIQGAKGNQGDKGIEGQKGEQNDKGQKGQKGEDGRKGDSVKGQKGTAAPLLTYITDVATKGALPAQPQPAGDAYYVTADNTYMVSDGTDYADVGEMVKGQTGNKGQDGAKGEAGTKGQKGQKGNKGEKGIGEKGATGDKGGTGQTGNKGDKGEVGPKGDKGDKGDKGLAATVDAGTTTTVASNVPAAVTNAGTTSAAVFDFDIPKGEKGAQGNIPAAGVTAHVNFNGTTANGILAPGDLYSEYGIAQVQKVATGNYIITYDVAFSGAQEYTVLCTPGYSGTGISTGVSAVIVSQTTTTTEIIVERGDNGNQYDADTIQLVAYGTGAGGAVVQKGEKGDFGGQKGDKGFQGPKGDKGQKGVKGVMPIGAASVHCAFDASAGAAFNYATDTLSQYNVSNIVRNAVGDFTVTFASPFTGPTDYTVVGSAGEGNHSSSGRTISIITQTANDIRFICERTDTGPQIDEGYIAIIAYGTGSQGNVATGPEGQKGEKGDFGGQKGVKGDKGEVGPKGDKGLIPAGAVTAHISFNGEAANGQITGSDIFAEYGITTLTKTGIGDYTVTFDTAFNAANAYTVQGTCGGRDFTGFTRSVNPVQLEANSCRFLVEGTGGGSSDVPYVSVVFYGNSTGGSASIKGDEGPKGEKGEFGGQKGAEGQKGEPGQKGETGATGIQGQKGEEGIPGTAVAKGDQGDKGEPGVTGAKGEEGSFEFQTSFVAFDASAGPSFSFGTGQIASNNIATVQRISSGVYDIYFNNNYRDGNYMVQTQYNDASYDHAQGEVVIENRTNGILRISVYRTTAFDDECPYISVLVMGRAN